MPSDEDTSTIEEPDIRRSFVLEQLTTLLVLKLCDVLETYKGLLEAQTRDIERSRRARLYETAFKMASPVAREILRFVLAAITFAFLYWFDWWNILLDALWTAGQVARWAIEKLKDSGYLFRIV